MLAAKGRITCLPETGNSSTDSGEVLVDESTEDDIGPHISSKHRIYTWTSYPFQGTKSSEMSKSSSTIYSASDNRL